MPSMGRTTCTEHQCLYSTATPLLPYGPYGLYRASVPVHYSYTSTPLWTVRPVHSLSACTRLHFTLPACTYQAAVRLGSTNAELHSLTLLLPIFLCFSLLFFIFKLKYRGWFTQTVTYRQIISAKVIDNYCSFSPLVSPSLPFVPVRPTSFPSLLEL